MGLIFRLSLRNLLRQKRRNILLGTGIAFGMMILVIANAFSHGMVDVLIKDVVSNAFGHLVIENTPATNSIQVIRDKDRVMKVINETVKKEDVVRVDESLGMFARAVGNGEADNVVVVGISPKTEKDKKEFFRDFFTLVDGNFDDFFSKEIEYPIIISQDKAKSLNVKLHDVVRVRIPMVTGQMEAAQLTVVAIANSNNTFMNIVLFMEGKRVKKLLGYKPWESGPLQINLKDPKGTAKYYADILHEKLKPGILSIAGKVKQENCNVLAFKNNAEAKKVLMKNVQIVQGDKTKALGKKGVLLPKELAQKLGLNVGDKFIYAYQTKYRGLYQEEFEVKGIFTSANKLTINTILMNGERIFDTYNRYIPKDGIAGLNAKANPLYSALATEWKLFPRSKDADDWQKNNRIDRRVKTEQAKFDIVTMYEGASQILNFEKILNLVTIIAVMILFFIILIGVINTLRMTIRERTREIGTVRAIGMQKGDVRNMFLLEILQLTAISCIVGIILGIIVMLILGSIRFESTSALSMILKNKHLFFKINPFALVGNFALIMLISAVTAYFPARRAAKLSAVKALQHYE